MISKPVAHSNNDGGTHEDDLGGRRSDELDESDEDGQDGPSRCVSVGYPLAV